MDNPATVADLENLGWDLSDGLHMAEGWLDLTFRRLLLAVPTIEESVASGHLSERNVADVVVTATLRVLRNPEGWESESGTIDDYQESFKRADASQDVYFTAAELRSLGPAAGQLLDGLAGSLKYV